MCSASTGVIIHKLSGGRDVCIRDGRRVGNSHQNRGNQLTASHLACIFQPWQPFLATQGCEATWFGNYTASAPVIEILQDYCAYFGLSAAACKLYANRKEVPKNKLLGQVPYCQSCGLTWSRAVFRFGVRARPRVSLSIAPTSRASWTLLNAYSGRQHSASVQS